MEMEMVVGGWSSVLCVKGLGGGGNLLLTHLAILTEI